MRLNKIVVLLLLTIPLLALLYALNFGGTTSFHNDEIRKDIRQEIHDLNERIIKSFRENKPEDLYDLLADENKEERFVSIKEVFQESNPAIAKSKFEFSQDYHVKYWCIGERLSSVPSRTDPLFFIHVTISNRGHKFVSLMETKGHFQDYLLYFEYEKSDGQWKLHALHGGIIRIANRTSVDWSNEAQQMYAKGHFLPAMIRLTVAGQFLRPTPLIQYEKEMEMVELQNKCRSQLKELPMPLQLETKPEIVGVAPQFVRSEIMPLVRYLSQIPLDNESGIRQEANSILPVMEVIFPGISSYSDHVVFKAFNEMPSDPKKLYKSYGVVVDTSK